MEFDELLRQYKDNPRRESCALLLTDPVLLKYCVIWLQVPLQQVTTSIAGESSWAALWDCVQVDVATIAMLADYVGYAERVLGRHIVQRFPI